MKIRNYQPEDEPAIRALYDAQGLDYVFPNLNHPEFFSRLVIEDSSGKIVMALFGRRTCEMFFFQDPFEGDPRARLAWFASLHLHSEVDLKANGMEDAHAWIPPGAIMGKFKRLLRLFGWVPATTWEAWTKPQLSAQPQLPLIQRRALKEVPHGS